MILKELMMPNRKCRTFVVRLLLNTVHVHKCIVCTVHVHFFIGPVVMSTLLFHINQLIIHNFLDTSVGNLNLMEKFWSVMS